MCGETTPIFRVEEYKPKQKFNIYAKPFSLAIIIYCIEKYNTVVDTIWIFPIRNKRIG